MGYLYRFLFYKILVFVFWVKTRDTQEWSAMFILSFLICINIGTIYSIVKATFLPSIHLESPINFVLIGSLVMAANYFYFIRNDRFRKIMDEFGKDSTANGFLSTTLTLLYLLISFYSMFYFGEKVREINSLN